MRVVAGVVWRVGGLLLLLAIGMAGCAKTPDEQQIREVIAQLQSAMESREPKAFMRGIDEDFTGGEGALDRNALHNLLRGQVLANERINVVLGPIEVVLQGDRATASMTATMAGGSARWIPERGAVYRIDSGWKKTGGEWRCINASWERNL